jgi:hypothetical protein
MADSRRWASCSCRQLAGWFQVGPSVRGSPSLHLSLLVREWISDVVFAKLVLSSLTFPPFHHGLFSPRLQHQSETIPLDTKVFLSMPPFGDLCFSAFVLLAKLVGRGVLSDQLT